MATGGNKVEGMVSGSGVKRIIGYTPVKNMSTHIITTVPIITPPKMSPLKSEHAILPKTVPSGNSPVILGTPQRSMYSNAGTSPRTPNPNMDQTVPWSNKKPLDYAESDYPEMKRRCKGEKGGKGLRHFSMKVCEKVQRKGTTSYNEVADELVAEFASSEPLTHRGNSDQAYDQKNIRRRVYDALNVLMAMNIISKEKKEIRWLGLPTNSAQECQNLEVEKQRRIERITVKTQQLYDLLLQQIAYKNLVERNKKLEQQKQAPSPGSVIPLPFIIINTNKDTVIDCSISSDKSEYLFNFNNTFEIHDDIEVLKRMGMAMGLDKGSCSPEDLERAKKLVPRNLEPYVIQMAQGGSDMPPGMKMLQSESGQRTSGPSTDATNNAASGALSRHSSVADLSDAHSRPGTSTPSEEDEEEDEEDDFLESDSDSEGGRIN